MCLLFLYVKKLLNSFRILFQILFEMFECLVCVCGVVNNFVVRLCVREKSAFVMNQVGGEGENC